MENDGANPADLLYLRLYAVSLRLFTVSLIREIRKDFHVNCPLSIFHSQLF